MRRRENVVYSVSAGALPDDEPHHTQCADRWDRAMEGRAAPVRAQADPRSFAATHTSRVSRRRPSYLESQQIREGHDPAGEPRHGPTHAGAGAQQHARPCGELRDQPRSAAVAAIWSYHARWRVAPPGGDPVRVAAVRAAARSASRSRSRPRAARAARGARTGLRIRPIPFRLLASARACRRRAVRPRPGSDRRGTCRRPPSGPGCPAGGSSPDVRDGRSAQPARSP